MTIFKSRFFNPGFIFRYLLIPNALVVFYSGCFALFLSILLSKNVNYHFSLRLLRYSSLSLLVLLLVLIALRVMKKENPAQDIPAGQGQKGSSSDLLILLLPLAPVTQYILKNQDILSLLDSTLIWVIFLALSFVFGLAIPGLIGKYSSYRLLASTGLAFIFTILNMASISGLLFWLEEGSLKIQLGLFALALVIIWLLLGLKNKKDMMFVVLIFFLGSVAIQFLPQNKSSAAYSDSKSYKENKLLNLTAERQSEITPSIYLLVYDAYVANETMLAYGIDNSEQEEFLVSQGFVLYPHTYSVGSYSLSTMNKVLNVSVDSYGHSRRGVSGDGVVQKVLKSLNYQTFGVFRYDYMFRGIGPRYDHYVPQTIIPSYALLLSGIMMGEFRFDIGLDTISDEQYVQSKHDVFAEPRETPIFIYTHSSLPGHSQNSGACLQDEAELFWERLTEANDEMEQDIALILENDPEALVIVAGDHGPYLTKNCLFTDGFYDMSEISRIDIQDRLGSFLAIRWPSDDYQKYDDIVVLQDIFPSIFAYIYQDEELLQSKIEPVIIDTFSVSGVIVNDGMIIGGANDGEPLFVSEK